jgi:hypothetical protein
MNKRMGALRAITTIVSCVLALGLVVGLNGCGKNDEELIRASVSEVMDLFKNPTKENLQGFVNEDEVDLSTLEEYDIDIYEFLGHSFKHFDYTINDVTVDGDTATASLTLTNTDLGAVVEETTTEITENIDDYADVLNGENGRKEFMKIFFNKIYEKLDASEETVSTDATLQLNKVDGEWEVDDSSMDAVVSAMYGGLEL